MQTIMIFINANYYDKKLKCPSVQVDQVIYCSRHTHMYTNGPGTLKTALAIVAPTAPALWYSFNMNIFCMRYTETSTEALAF